MGGHGDREKNQFGMRNADCGIRTDPWRKERASLLRQAYVG